MIIFIAPSKTFNPTDKVGTSAPLFIDKTKELEKKIKRFTKDELAKKMKLSPKLSAEVYSFYHHGQARKALDLYSGVSYKAMDSKTLRNEEGLYIIDAYYGLVRPSDMVKPYRLDFTMTLIGNLYDYWKDTIANYLTKAHEDDFLIDLTSKEFSPLIPKHLNLVRIDFVEKNKTISSVLLKQMRGKMTRYLLENPVLNVEEIKKIKIEGFEYDPQSSQTDLVFSR